MRLFVLAINLHHELDSIRRCVDKYEHTKQNKPVWYDAFVKVFGDEELRQETKLLLLFASYDYSFADEH